MYAVVQQGGHQYRVRPGDRLLVDRMSVDVGSLVELAPVLVLADDASVTIGTPAVEGARVAARVVAHANGPKLRVFKYKPKKRYRRTRGYRSRLTELRVEAVLGPGEPLPEIAPAAESGAGRKVAASAEGPATAPPKRRSSRRAATPAAPRDDEFTEV